MEEIRTVAVALYNNGSSEFQASVQDFFRSMDTDGSGSISKKEFTCFLEKQCLRINPTFFSLLDEDGNGLLDFKELLAFFYFTNFREVFCDGTGCRKFLFGLYFTCVACFMDQSCKRRYGLCLDCFQRKNHNHGTTQFLDNYSMLNLVRKKKYAVGTGSWNESVMFQSSLYFGVSKELSPPTKVGQGKHAEMRCRMEEIRRVAVALYNNGSDRCRAEVQDFFRSMDTDRKGSISEERFTRYLNTKCPGEFNHPTFFSMLDLDGSGALDFTELVTFLYMTNSRAVYCQGFGCHEFLFNLYFTCLHCFAKTPYDLCLDCFQRMKHQNHNREHTLFLDNYAVLNLLMNQRENDAATPGSSRPAGGSRPEKTVVPEPRSGNQRMREGIETARSVMDPAARVVGVASNAMSLANGVMGVMNLPSPMINVAAAMGGGMNAMNAMGGGMNAVGVASGAMSAMGVATNVLGNASYAMTAASVPLNIASAVPKCTIM